MLRSNSKQALNNLRKYIFDHADFDNYDLDTPTEYSADSFHYVCFTIMHIFADEYLTSRPIRKPYQEYFLDWLSGLPSAFDSCYYYNRSAVDDLGDILEETEAEKARFTEQQAERMLSCLIWREIYKACDYVIA